MNVLAKIRNNPLWILWVLLRRISPLIKSDKIFIKLEYILRTHKLLNLSNPQSFNEKLQWLKLYARHEEYTQLVDKYAVKLYVTKRIGEKYVIPTLGVWERFEDIDFSITIFNKGLKIGNCDTLSLVHDHTISVDEDSLEYEKTRFVEGIKRKSRKTIKQRFRRKYIICFNKIHGSCYS